MVQSKIKQWKGKNSGFIISLSQHTHDCNLLIDTFRPLRHWKPSLYSVKAPKNTTLITSFLICCKLCMSRYRIISQKWWQGPKVQNTWNYYWSKGRAKNTQAYKNMLLAIPISNRLLQKGKNDQGKVANHVARQATRQNIAWKGKKWHQNYDQTNMNCPKALPCPSKDTTLALPSLSQQYV